MAEAELPLSDEPNLGAWKIKVTGAKTSNTLDVQVAEYTLPKYEIKVEVPKEWVLASEPITGKISAEYSFGKPVTGEVTIEALRYVGEWEVYATVNSSIEGEVDFELPAVGYVAGTPASSGQGNIQLNIRVEEKSTGYREETSRILTVTQTPMVLKVIPESQVFKPGLPFKLLLASQTPDSLPVDSKIEVIVNYSNSEFESFKSERQEIDTINGLAFITITPPKNAIALSLDASEISFDSTSMPARTNLVLQASYSPSGNFIHLVQSNEDTPSTGETIIFDIYSTSEARSFYYEVIARGKVLFSDFTTSPHISFTATPLMAPSAKLLVYQILPNSEVAADYLPFNVEASYPNNIEISLSSSKTQPGDEVEIVINTEGEAKVAVAAVDRSVFILAENRMNLEQVFNELEKLYMKPQAEIHELSFYPNATTVGVADVFKSAGVVVMTNNKIPESRSYEAKSGSFLDKIGWWLFGKGEFGLENAGAIPPTAAPQMPTGELALAEIERVRQFFPETWLWFDTITTKDGIAAHTATVPDSITTWMLRAVAVSKTNGLGVAEASLVTFQPFFLTADLPYAAIRGEEFPIRVSVYNYLDTPQQVQISLAEEEWFELQDESIKTLDIAANDIAGASFMIKPIETGTQPIEISARSTQAADALIKTIIIQPEGVAREIVENLMLSAGFHGIIDTSVPELIIDDSGRSYIALTTSVLTQTIDGLEELLQIPFGCGEQNMIVFAPDVYITRYLIDSGQIKPEIMAKAEKLMITGYQRQLTYRRTDGSFSAFGMQDQEGSLWLTAFVLKCFSQAKGLIYIDETVLNEAAQWVISHQNSDGSFDQAGFIHHQDMLGGLKGKNALTAFISIALLEAGENTAAQKATAYLENQVNKITDPYTAAITAYAIELAGSAKASDAYDALMSFAQEDENGLYWGAETIEPEPITSNDPVMPAFQPDVNRSASIENTAYATLALIQHGDDFNASRAAKWLTSKRNAYGGYGSTQDTVITLQALTKYSSGIRSDADLAITLIGIDVNRQININQSNYDVLQIIELPINQLVEINVTGSGDAIGQLVKRFNEPEASHEPAAQMLAIDIDYDATTVEVNDTINISVTLAFNPLPSLEVSEAGMIIADISIPTGFEAITDSLQTIVSNMDNIKRYEIAGRKVIFYIENMKPGEIIDFNFQVKALYPVKAMGVVSTAYSYYKPDIRGESLGESVTIS